MVSVQECSRTKSYPNPFNKYLPPTEIKIKTPRSLLTRNSAPEARPYCHVEIPSYCFLKPFMNAGKEMPTPLVSPFLSISVLSSDKTAQPWTGYHKKNLTVPNSNKPEARRRGKTPLWDCQDLMMIPEFLHAQLASFSLISVSSNCNLYVVIFL